MNSLLMVHPGPVCVCVVVAGVGAGVVGKYRLIMDIFRLTRNSGEAEKGPDYICPGYPAKNRGQFSKMSTLIASYMGLNSTCSM